MCLETKSYDIVHYHYCFLSNFDQWVQVLVFSIYPGNSDKPKEILTHTHTLSDMVLLISDYLV